MKNETLESLAEIEFYKPLSTTIAGFVIPVATGFISVVSSSLILYIIFKSKKDCPPTNLLATYHRIMASMSAFDVTSSACVVLRQTFMPKDHMVYQFKGPILGNSFTCRIQGWFVIFGICGATTSTSCLCWYFVFSIVFKVDMKNIRKYIAPLMYVYIASISIAVPTFFANIDMMNPNLTTGTCDIAPYPISCDEELWWDWNECIWEEGELETYFENQNVILYAIVLQFVLVFIGMALILVKSCQNKKEANNTRQCESEEDTERKRGRVLINQSLMYMVALVFTWLWFFIHYVHFNIYELEIMNAIFFPLQGFWNLLIFLYDKTFHLRETNPELGFVQAVKMIIKSPSDVMIVFEDLSKVSSNTPSSPDLDMENLSYDEGIEDSKENNLSMYDSISAYRNVHSDTSHALPDEQDYTLEIKLPALYDPSSEHGEVVFSNDADHSSSIDKSSTCHCYEYYDMPKE